MPQADPNAETKAAFRAAMERKRQQQTQGNAPSDRSRGNAKGSDAKGGKRQFRRKSGG